MAVLPFKAATRLCFRKPHHLHKFPSKRHSSSNKPDNPTNGTSIPVPNTVAAIPIWHRLGPLSRGFQAYGRSQRKRPYTTQFFSSLVIYFLGDLSAQKINGDNYDPMRTLRAFVISAGSSIPSYKWYSKSSVVS
jgi:protein Mpv17